ncbi:MAG TPA: ATP-binding cassette domain-containing protein [Azospirillaceae bacterium]|nr:ATP-binding cassette domain-containing protein [Azospirillaceae bacterium]
MPAAGASPVLTLDIREKRFASTAGGEVVAIRDLAFHVGRGESVALFGPSGCGKTTTLNIVAGLDRRFEGTLAFPASAAGGPALGCVFQEPRLLPWRTLERNVELVLPPARRGTGIAAGWLERMGLAEAAGRFPEAVSVGMQRRAALARAFAVEPELLLLDEPFVSLDQALAARLRRLLAETLGRTPDDRPCAVLLVTHDLREAIELADRILFLSPAPARVLTEVVVPGRRGERGEREIEAFRRALLDRAEPVFRAIG